MNDAKHDLTQWCTAVVEATSSIELTESTTAEISTVQESIQRQELLIPVVGTFSAGKSTLINKILGEDLLPTAITPETSLAMELRYSDEPRIEAIREDGSVKRYNVDQIKQVTAEADQFSHAKLYLENIRIRELEPLVLVDMPGFDSPLDAHNKAIMAYVDQGCHYLVMASVQEGTVSKSLMRRIREISQLGRGLSVFLTKSDLKPGNDLDSLVSHFKETLADDCDYEGDVIAITQSAPDAVVKLLKSIPSENLFFSLYRQPVQHVTNNVLDAINIRISALKKDSASLTDCVTELESTLGKIQRRSEEELESVERRNQGNTVVNEVLADVGKALEKSLDELVSIAKGGDTDATERCLLDIVRAELNVSMNNRLGAISRDIATDFNGTLSNLDKAMSGLEISSEFTAKVSDAFTNFINPLITKGRPAATTKAGQIGKAFATTAGTLAIGRLSGAGLAAVVNPALGLLVAFLPEILGFIFGGINESKKEEKIRSTLLGQAFPQIKSKLRPELQQIVSETLREMVENIRAGYEAQIVAKKEELQNAMQKKDVDQAEKEQTINALQGAREAVASATNELIARYN